MRVCNGSVGETWQRISLRISLRISCVSRAYLDETHAYLDVSLFRVQLLLLLQRPGGWAGRGGPRQGGSLHGAAGASLLDKRQEGLPARPLHLPRVRFWAKVVVEFLHSSRFLPRPWVRWVYAPQVGLFLLKRFWHIPLLDLDLVFPVRSLSRFPMPQLTKAEQDRCRSLPSSRRLVAPPCSNFLSTPVYASA